MKQENKTEYRKCPKCGLNYITGSQTLCGVCEAVAKPYRGNHCSECGARSGPYELCWKCHKTKHLSFNEKRAVSGYRTDVGMVGVRTRNVCEICGTPAYGKLCGRCYMAIHYGEEREDTDD